jgi:hypothetical protein
VLAPLLAALALTQPAHAASPAPPTEWLLVVATEGGFMGMGKGGVEVRSSGQMYVSPYAGPKCEYQLQADDIEHLREAVRTSRPRYWKPRYVRADNPNGCCDQISWLLFLNTGSGRAELRYATGWFDDSRKLAPMDAQRLHAAALALTRKYPCKPRR